MVLQDSPAITVILKRNITKVYTSNDFLIYKLSFNIEQSNVSVVAKFKDPIRVQNLYHQLTCA